MASGNTLVSWVAQGGVPPGTLYATFDTMVGGSTPAESVPIIDFDDTTQEYIDLYGYMPSNYSAATGVTLTIGFSAAETQPDVAEWLAAFRRVANDAEALTSSHTYDFNSVVATAPSALGEVAYATVTFTAGADMDSVVAGDYFILRVARDPTPSSGVDVTGDCSIHFVAITET